MWSYRHSSFEWSYSAVPDAYKKFGHSETSGKSCLLTILEFVFYLLILPFCLFLVKQLLRNKLVSTARESIRKNANLSQLYTSMQEAYTGMQTPLVYQTPAALVCSIKTDIRTYFYI